MLRGRPRGLWDEMDGYDEKFSGYGYEDLAFCIAAETYGGKQVVRVPARCTTCITSRHPVVARSPCSP